MTLIRPGLFHPKIAKIEKANGRNCETHIPIVREEWPAEKAMMCFQKWAKILKSKSSKILVKK